MRVAVLSMEMALLITAACGSSGPVGSDSRVGAGGGDTAGPANADSAAGSTGRDAAVAGTGCGNLTCTGRADDLMAGCMASGACTKQTTSTGEVRCFENGVKWSRSAHTDSGTTGSSSSIVVTAKKGNALCYTKTFAGFIPTSGGLAAATSTLTIADGAGATVATANGDASGMITVLCPGGVATIVDDPCYTNLTAYLLCSGTPATCTEGSCTF